MNTGFRSSSHPRLLRAAAPLAMAALLGVACDNDTGVGPGTDAGNSNNVSETDGAVGPDGTVADGSLPDANIPDAFVRPPGDAFVLPDSGADAFVHPTSPFGPAMVLNNLVMSGGTQGLSPFSSVVNPDLADAVANGNLLLVMEFIGLDDTTGVIDDADVTVVIYRAVDADGDPGNNFTGGGTFQVETASAAVVPDVAISGGQLDIVAGTFPYLGVSIPGFGDLLIIDPAIQLHVQDGFTGLDSGHIDGSVPGRILDQLPDETGVSNNPNASLLDMLVTSAFELQPDVDVDGDGQLEQFSDNSPTRPGYDELVSYCVDYFGLFDDDNCPQFPEIWDGYSVGFGFTAVPATIVGSF
jgi:hypothetical protein